jgi:hypothetical protein
MPETAKFSQPTRPKKILKIRRKPQGSGVSDPQEVSLRCKQKKIGRAPDENLPHHHSSLSKEQVAFILSAKGMALRKHFPAETYAHNAMMGRRREGAIVHTDLATLRSFLLNVGLMPGKGMTLDRINNLDPEYAIDKVRWADKHTQNNNKSDTLTFYCSKSGEVYTASRLAKIQNVTADAIRKRRREGWSDDEIIAGEKLSPSSPLPEPATGSGYIPASAENSPKSKSADKKALWAAALLWQEEVSAHCENRELTPDWRVLSNASGALSQIGPVVVGEIIHAVVSSWELFMGYVQRHDAVRSVPHHPNFEFVFRFHAQAALDFTLDETMKAKRQREQEEQRLIAEYRKVHGPEASIPPLFKLRQQERERQEKLRQELLDRI